MTELKKTTAGVLREKACAIRYARRGDNVPDVEFEGGGWVTLTTPLTYATDMERAADELEDQHEATRQARLVISDLLGWFEDPGKDVGNPKLLAGCPNDLRASLAKAREMVGAQ